MKTKVEKIEEEKVNSLKNALITTSKSKLAKAKKVILFFYLVTFIFEIYNLLLRNLMMKLCKLMKKMLK
jgi:hypothetical protein